MTPPKKVTMVVSFWFFTAGVIAPLAFPSELSYAAFVLAWLILAAGNLMKGV